MSFKCHHCGGSLSSETLSRLAACETEAKKLREIIKAASHALRSYQYGNSSSDLAKEIADQCDHILGNENG